MALRPTIHKFRLSLSDLDRGFYDTLNLTVARHPSETLERMMARVLAFCFNAGEAPEFCKGLSDADEPDLWVRSLDGGIQLWVDVGEPAFERVRKASRAARQVKIYSFNSKSPVWWGKQREDFGGLRASVYRLPWAALRQLAAMAERSVEASVTISGGGLLFAAEAGQCELDCEVLQEK